MDYCVYMLLCQDGSYYTGYTQNLANRVKQHMSGKGSRYTRVKKPKEIVYIEEFDTRSNAMRREREIKLLTHKEKTDLINKKK